MAPVPGRTAARGTWHVPPRGGLQKDVDAPSGTVDPELAGHTYTTPTCVLFVVAGGVGCRLHAPEAANFFDKGSSAFRKL